MLWLWLLLVADPSHSHLSGWLWPLMITACAAEDPHRAALRALLPLARSPIGDRDNSDIAMRVGSAVLSGFTDDRSSTVFMRAVMRATLRTMSARL